MAEKSAISWTRSTFNPWIGCTKIGPGCDRCYAAVSTPARSQGIVWGPGQPRKRTVPSNWAKPLQWEKLAAEERRTGVLAKGHEGWARPGFWPVFCASLADVFDNEVPHEWRDDLWKLIDATPSLSWLIVTKRIGNARGMLPGRWLVDGFPHNVRILITVVNQEEAERDIPKLLALKCKNGISYEPALGPVNWRALRPSYMNWMDALEGRAHEHPVVYQTTRRVEWIIAGGESDQGGAKARPFDIQWARDTVRQCRDSGVPVFVKQLGSHCGWDGKGELLVDVECKDHAAIAGLPHWKWRLCFHDRAGADPAEWPADLRVQEFPE